MKSAIFRISVVCLAAVAALSLAFLGTAAAASAAEPANGSILDLLSPIKDAFTEGKYAYAGSLALVVAVAAARRYGGSRFPWFHTAQGSASLVLLGSFGATMSARLAAGVLAPDMAWDAFKIAFLAAGGYAALKALVVQPFLVPLLDKYPTAAKPLRFVLWIFDGAPDDADPPTPPSPPPPAAPAPAA